MNALLKSERADIDKKRSDMLKLQGEFRVKIRELEDNLLQALSAVQGSILEDDKVIATLEKLKKESAEIQEQVAQTDLVMAEIEETCNLYSPGGLIAAKIFFLLETLGVMNTLYRYSLSFFFDIFGLSYKDCAALQELKDDYPKRLSIIIHQLFVIAYQKVSPGMQEADILVYALQLAKIKSDAESPFPSEELDLLLKGAGVTSANSTLAAQCAQVLKNNLSPQQLKSLQDLHTLPCFEGLVGHIKEREAAWKNFLEHSEPESVIPNGWRKADDKSDERTKMLQETLILKALRPDRVVYSCQHLVENVFGPDFLNTPEFNLREVIARDSKASSPIMMVSAPGFDPSGKVTELAREDKKTLASAAMGSKEGFAVADKGIVAASKQGTWVLLKNVHLSIDWLHALEKNFYGMNPHPNFRLFLTMEFSPRIPANLIRLSRVFVFEPPSGVRASLQRSFAQILPSDRTDKAPVERCRLHFLLAFLHAIVLERLRYSPVGWSKKYEFGDSDQICGRDTIDAWVDSVSQGGKLSNISPDKIPWDAVQTVLSEAIYGGRVDNEFDLTILQSFIKHLFQEKSFNSDFSLNLSWDSDHSLPSPDARKREQFLAWIDTLPAKGNPAWLGLPVHAEKLLRINRAMQTLRKWLMLQATGGGDMEGAPEKSAGKRKSRKKSAVAGNWLSEINEKVKRMLSSLPESLAAMQRTEASMKDPLWRCINREVETCRSLLKKVRADLTKLQQLCEGAVKSTNELRLLAQTLSTDGVPKSWKMYVVPESMTATEWLADYIIRLEQLKEMSTTDIQKYVLWFGGLFFPEAFLTASRQATAQALQVSLEELNLVVDIGGKEEKLSFMVKGLYMEGAKWDTAGGGQLALTNDLSVPLPQTCLRWVHRDSPEYKRTVDYLKIPVYLTGFRSTLLCPFALKVPKEVDPAVWLQRSVCITLWSKR